MKVVLIRHGSRDHTMERDNGLNLRGREQAASFFPQLEPKGRLPVPTHLFSSPKNRAKETLAHLSEQLKIPLVIEPLLDEQTGEENSVAFRSRVRKFLDALTEKYKSSDCIYLCTHADWLEDAMIVLSTDAFEHLTERAFSTAEARTFEIREGIWLYRS